MMDAVVGLVFTYVLLSLICSAVKEAVESVMNRRAAALQEGMVRLLGRELAGRVASHPLMAGLSDAYVPPGTFSAALMDVLAKDAAAGESIKEILRALEAARLPGGLKEAIETWFGSAMDAVSEGYRRHTQAWLAGIGVAVTIAVNADSVAMLGALAANPEVRGRVAQAGSAYKAGSGMEALGELRSLGIPLGWSGPGEANSAPWNEPWPRGDQWWRNVLRLIEWHAAGWLLTVAAISLGAPFWFDLLKRLVPERTKT